MPDSYVIKDQHGVYFLTFQIVSWLVPIAIGIKRKRYRDIVIDAFNYCVGAKGLRVHAWCIMSNHVHCILSSALDNVPLGKFKLFSIVTNNHSALVRVLTTGVRKIN